MSLDFLTQVFPAVLALVGFPAFLAAIINLLKKAGLPDGAAPKISMWANLIVFIAVFYFALSGKIELLAVIDRELGTLAVFVATFTSFATEIGLTKLFHAALRGTPGIGFSYSLK